MVTDLVTRLSRSIGRSHKFKLLPNWFQGSVLTFGNVQDFLKGVSRTNVPQRWSSTENILEVDLKPGFLNIAVVIGANSMKRLNQSLDRDAPLTYILGVGQSFRRDLIENIVPSSKRLFVQTLGQSVETVKELSLDLCSGCSNMDIYFLLDTSNSIGPEQFARECKLAADLMKSMQLPNGHSPITTIDYSDSPELHRYADSPQFIATIPSHKWRGGNTMTHSALEMVMAASERNSNDKRQVAILMSDGASTSPDRTEKMAAKIHNSQLEMFVVGIGENVNLEELKVIASSPSHLYMEDSITPTHLSEAICNGATDNNIPESNQDCREEFDIVFVLDSSWSLRTEKNFRKEIHFVTELSDNLQLDFKRVSVSVITYADQAKEYNFRSKNEFSSAVLNLPWLGGNTYTDRALSIVLENVENRANSVQSTVERPLVVLVITDGGSTSPFVLEKVVARLKRFKFVKLFAIGVGVSINIKELGLIASDPSDSHLFMVDDLEVNNKILKSLLKSQICRDTQFLSLISPPKSFSCPADVDLVFVLDSSSSLGVVENPDFYFLKEIAFVIDVIKLGNIDFRQSRVSVITYSDVIRLHQYRSETDLVSNIIHLPFLGGNTCTDIALDLMLDELNYFKSVSNGRKAAIGVILTDGLSTRPEYTSSSARRIHDVGYRIVAIGVGARVNINAITDMASLPKNENVFLLDALNWRTSFLSSLHNGC